MRRQLAEEKPETVSHLTTKKKPRINPGLYLSEEDKII
jgi:hypothetical protein